MNKLIALTKVLLKSGGSSFNIIKNRKNIIKSSMYRILIIIACLIPLAIMLGGYISKIYDMLSLIDQEGIILGLSFIAVCFMEFTFGIFYIMGTFYLSEDTDNLLYLPLRGWQILGARFIVVLMYEYITELIILLPSILVFGIKSSAGVLYYVYSICIFILLPVLPLVLASIPVMLIMRFTKIAKNKDKLKVIGGLVILLFSVGFNVLIQKMSRNMMNEDVIQGLIVEGNKSFITLISKFFPSAKIASDVVLKSSNIQGVISFLLFIGISIVAIVIFLSLGEMLYLNSVVGISETTSKRQKLTQGQINKHTLENTPFKAYLIKEIRILLRTPAYLISCVIINFLWPLFFMIPFLSNNEGIEGLNHIGDMINNPRIAALVVAVGVALILFMSSNTSVSSTSISREGKNFYVNKFLPISFEEQVLAKTMVGIILGSIGMIMLLAVIFFIFHIPKIIIAIIALLGLLGIVFANFTGVLIDIHRPKLEWDNEQRAVKQNFNAVFNGIPSIAIAALLVFIVFKLRLTLILTVGGIIVIFGILDFILYKILMIKAREVYAKIE